MDLSLEAPPSTSDPRGRQIALLPDDHLYEVYVVDDPGAVRSDWHPRYVEANVALHGADGCVAFYRVQDDVWWPVITFPPGWYGLYRPVRRVDDLPAEDFTPDIGETSPPAEDRDEGDREQVADEPLPEFMTMEDFRRRFPSLQAVATGGSSVTEDAVQMFDTDVELRHKRLKDVWEGKGDDSSEVHTTFNDPDDLSSGWTQEQYDEHIDKLRRESDAQSGRSEALRVFPYTTMTDFEGVPPTRYDSDFEVIPVPPQATGYLDVVSRPGAGVTPVGDQQ